MTAITSVYSTLQEALRRGELNEWEAGFARGFIATCRRTGGASPKQIAVARKVAKRLAEGPVIEGEGLGSPSRGAV